MGDLILTTTGGLSRNKSFGLEMAKAKGKRNNKFTTISC